MQIEVMVAPVVEALGYEYWGLELHRNPKHGLLRIYIDSSEGITVEDCAKVSREVSAILDVEDPISGHYELEVSSPGLERPLFKREHYERYVGELLQLRLRRAERGQRNFCGLLQAVGDNEIVVEVEQQPLHFSLDNIDKANLRYEP